MFDIHNDLRGSNGEGSLAIDAQLVQLARQRAQDMADADCFSHYGPTNSGSCPQSGTAIFATMLGAISYPYQIAGENLARNNYPIEQSVDVVLRGLMDSAPHRGLILDATFTHIGVANVEDAEGMKYYVMILLSM